MDDSNGVSMEDMALAGSRFFPAPDRALTVGRSSWMAAHGSKDLLETWTCMPSWRMLGTHACHEGFPELAAVLELSRWPSKECRRIRKTSLGLRWLRRLVTIPAAVFSLAICPAPLAWFPHSTCFSAFHGCYAHAGHAPDCYVCRWSFGAHF